MIRANEFKEAMHILGFYQVEDSYEMRSTSGSTKISASASLSKDSISLKFSVNGKRITSATKQNIEDAILCIEETLSKYGWSAFSPVQSSCRRVAQNIFAAINTSDLSSRLFRVKSSNVWAYRLFMRDRHDKTGDLIVQFKARDGGPGDIYQYYDVPFTLFRRWQATTSKGHFFWKYIRNYYKYAKLTGDKRGKLANAINNQIRKMPNINFMIKFVNSFLDGSIDRQELDSDLIEYWNMCNEDMASEDTDFTKAFKREIVDTVMQLHEYDDEKLRDVLSRNLRSVKRLLA